MANVYILNGVLGILDVGSWDGQGWCLHYGG
jgi:hypothetical protein